MHIGTKKRLVMMMNGELCINEKDALINCLKDPFLFERIVLDGLDNIIVGEDLARKTIFLCAVGCLVINSTRTSYNLMINSESGAGKDWLTNNVLNLLPKEMVLKRTRITPTALTYWHNSSFEPKWTWDAKTLYLEDCSNNIINSEVFKVFTSNSSYATVVRDQRAIDIEIKGKPTVILTSASADPHPEIIRRFTVINLNESKEQTDEVMLKWLEFAEKGEIPSEINDYQQALKYLKPYKVKVPFARKLHHFFMNDNIIMRTYISRFIDYIRASTVLHQYAREKDSDDFLLSTKQDYEIAKEVLLATSSNDRMVPITKSQQEIMLAIKEMGMCEDLIISESGAEKKILRGWTHSEICTDLPFNRTYVYEQLNKLWKLGFIIKESYRFDYSKKRVAVYHYKEYQKLSLPMWGDLIK